MACSQRAALLGRGATRADRGAARCSGAAVLVPPPAPPPVRRPSAGRPSAAARAAARPARRRAAAAAASWARRMTRGSRCTGRGRWGSRAAPAVLRLRVRAVDPAVLAVVEQRGAADAGRGRRRTSRAGGWRGTVASSAIAEDGARQRTTRRGGRSRLARRPSHPPRRGEARRPGVEGVGLHVVARRVPPRRARNPASLVQAAQGPRPARRRRPPARRGR